MFLHWIGGFFLWAVNNEGKQLVPRNPPHHRSATDQDETVVFTLSSRASREERAEYKMDCPQATFGRQILCTTPPKFRTPPQTLLVCSAVDSCPGKTLSVLAPEQQAKHGKNDKSTHFAQKQDPNLNDCFKLLLYLNGIGEEFNGAVGLSRLPRLGSRSSSDLRWPVPHEKVKIAFLVGVSAPKKKNLPPPPKFPASTLPVARPPPLPVWETLPPGIFTHPPSASDSAFPSPEQKKKYPKRPPSIEDGLRNLWSAR